MKKVSLPISLLLSCFFSYSQPGTLDLSFANKGYVHNGFGHSLHVYQNTGMQVLSHPDGTSYLVFTLVKQAFVMHRMANGDIDPLYGQGGYSVPVTMEEAVGIMQPDGKIVLGGALLGRSEFLFARLNTDGTLDNSFSNDGLQRVHFSVHAHLNSVAVHNGKILGVGYSGMDFAIARLLPDGSPDNSFSDDGQQTVTFGGGLQYARAVAVAPTGRIVVAGNAQGNMAVAALLDNGSLDNSFSSDGKQLISVEGSSGCAAVAIQPDGKIVLAGMANAGITKMALARLNTNGNLDNDFSNDGLLTIDFGVYSEARGVALQSNGKIVVAGAAAGSKSDVAVASINPDGTPDNSFSGDGMVIIALTPTEDAANSVAVQPDGRILVAGYAGYRFDPDASFAIVRFNVDGSLDNSFNGNGIIIGYKPLSPTRYLACAVQPDGKVIVAGGTQTENGIRIALVRYNPDGTPDNGFSGDGKLSIDFETGGQLATAMVLQPDGKIVIGGNWANPTNSYFLVIRLNPDGTLDNSFSGDGKALIDFDGSNDESLRAIALQPDGKVVAAGSMNFGSGMTIDYAVARLNADGTPDNSFSGDGKVRTDLGAGESAAAVLIMPDGKIVVPGTYQPGEDANFMLVRYNPDGTLDQSFNGKGWINSYTYGMSAVSAAALQPDGKIVVAGSYLAGTRFEVVRYTSNGVLDNSFSDDGILISSVFGYVSDMALQPNGKIILAGGNYDGTGLLFARVNADGTPDASFITASTANTELGDLGSLRSVCLQGNRLYAAGHMAYNGVEGFVAAFKLDCSLNATIPDAYTLSSGVDANTAYIGYAPASDLTLSAQTSNGMAPYSYLWSNGATASNITITPITAANWTVTVTDAAGCSATASKFVKVSDVRCGNNNNKVLVCQVPNGNPANAKTNCISASAVPAQLNNGAYLGSCNDARSGASMRQAATEDETPEFNVYPNPSKTEFTLIARMPGTQLVSMIVFDNLGRVVERRQIFSNQQIRFGMNYRPGIYYVEYMHGEVKKRITVIKN